MDLIDRQVAIDAVEKESQVDGAYGYMDTKSIIDLLNDMPSAQSEIVKCKDCIHRYEKINIPMCDFVDFCPTDSSYCSLGEK